MIRTAFISLVVASLLPVGARAMQLDLPTAATQSFDQAETGASYDLPVGPWNNGAIDTKRVEGDVKQSVWRLPGSGLTTMQLLGDLRAQLVSGGYDIVFECAEQQCGGFDFRFDTRVAAEPDMHVDLGDYRFLSATGKDADGADKAISLMVSRSDRTGFVQVIDVGPNDVAPVEVATSSKSLSSGTVVADSDLDRALHVSGHVVLEDLTFERGSASLSHGDFVSLESLSSFLAANPDKSIALVGHTDAEGSLAGNIVLSKARAGSVLDRLVKDFGVRREQLNAEGMGYLSPRASNLTDEGRQKNRRVEAILTSLD